MKISCSFLMTLLLCQGALADLNVFVCEPEWQSLLSELGGSHLRITTASTATQDPHYLQAKPSLIVAIRDADLLVCSGAQLEVGWLPLLLRRSGNAAIQPGSPGHVLAAMLVRRIEVPQSVDRRQGDIHPEGNPHVHLNPANVRRIAQVLGDRLAQLDPANSNDYNIYQTDFLSRWDKASARWSRTATPLTGIRVMVHHTSFSYLIDWLKLNRLADLEPKPGLPPSAAHLASLLSAHSVNPPIAILRTPYSSARSSKWLAQRLNSRMLELPYTVGGGGTADLFEVFDRTIEMLLEVST